MSASVSASAFLREVGPLGAAFHRQVLAAGRGTDEGGLVAIAGAILMRATMHGHSCLSIDDIAAHAGELGAADLSGEALCAALATHAWVGEGDGATPLVHENGQLFLRRFREAEVRLARAIRSRLAHSRFSVITGGPGTGKTTTVAHLLVQLLEADPTVRVALAAPTGKAAQRLGEAVRDTLTAMGVNAAVRERLPSTGRTVHRLLGYRPNDDSFQRSANDPLEHDVVIVDEASMVPLLLMDALFAALRPEARVVLVGDHDQLASVESGSVLSDIVTALPLRGAVTRLVHSYRFDDTKGIGALARAIRDGDADAAMSALANTDGSIVHAGDTARGAQWLDVMEEPAAALYAAASPDAALAALTQLRVLCVTNVGPAGTEALTPRIEQKLRQLGHAASGRSYRGRPVLVTRNDYTLDVFNGDIGVVWDEVDADGSTAQRLFIASTEPGIAAKGFPLSQLSDAVTAWAMTVHKSQGSEFDTVVVVLPDTDVRVLTRELLYTAVTRAKSRVVIVGPEETLRRAVGRTSKRSSGLAARLG